MSVVLEGTAELQPMVKTHRSGWQVSIQRILYRVLWHGLPLPCSEIRM